MAAESQGIINRLPHWAQHILQVPSWAYLVSLAFLGLIASIVFGVGVVLVWALLLAVLLAMGKAIIWAFKVSSFLLTAFCVVFVIIAFFSLVYQLLT